MLRKIMGCIENLPTVIKFTYNSGGLEPITLDSPNRKFLIKNLFFA